MILRNYDLGVFSDMSLGTTLIWEVYRRPLRHNGNYLISQETGFQDRIQMQKKAKIQLESDKII
jgi:hypothetical protein